MTAAWKAWPLPTDRTSMWEWQAGRCAWCGIDNDRINNRAMALDHCHQTGLVRGYLCGRCNTSEGTSSHVDWNEWRDGDHPAQALGHFEVYRNPAGGTPISSSSALTYFTAPERGAWWAIVGESVELGGRLPSEAPWIPAAVARRDADLAFAKVAVENLFAGSRTEVAS